MRKSLAAALGTSMLSAVALGTWRAYHSHVRSASGGGEWDDAPFPFPAAPRPATMERPWVEPVDGVCVASHPIKGKLGSGIYHMPGGMNYERTHPDRCYLDPEAAEHDGLRPAKL